MEVLQGNSPCSYCKELKYFYTNIFYYYAKKRNHLSRKFKLKREHICLIERTIEKCKSLLKSQNFRPSQGTTGYIYFQLSNHHILSTHYV
jgi:hypothetical protein